MSFLDPTVNLSSRQETVCRHFASSGNAADAARRAGYAERSARQTGCARLEQAWDAAVASASAYLMPQIARLQAGIAGLTRPAAIRRAVLWPLPDDDVFGEMEAGEAHEAGAGPGTAPTRCARNGDVSPARGAEETGDERRLRCAMDDPRIGANAGG